MYRITAKREIASDIISLKIDAPLIAKKAKPGQFVVVRIDENEERIPLTIQDWSPENGTVCIDGG